MNRSRECRPLFSRDSQPGDETLNTGRDDLMGSRPGRLMHPAANAVVWTALILVLVTALTLLLRPQSHRPRAFPGYTLVALLYSKNTELIDMQGRVVRR